MKTFFASLIGNHSVAEYVLLHLTDEYLRACPAYSNRKYLPGQYDLIANACLFLCSEYKGQLSNRGEILSIVVDEKREPIL